jgi:hypothetical protein
LQRRKFDAVLLLPFYLAFTTQEFYKGHRVLQIFHGMPDRACALRLQPDAHSSVTLPTISYGKYKVIAEQGMMVRDDMERHLASFTLWSLYLPLVLLQVPTGLAGTMDGQDVLKRNF